MLDVVLLGLALLALGLLELEADCPLDDEQLLTVRATAAIPVKLARTRRRTGRPRPLLPRWPVSFPWPGAGMKITSSIALSRVPALRRKPRSSYLNAA